MAFVLLYLMVLLVSVLASAERSWQSLDQHRGPRLTLTTTEAKKKQNGWRALRQQSEIIPATQRIIVGTATVDQCGSGLWVLVPPGSENFFFLCEFFLFIALKWGLWRSESRIKKRKTPTSLENIQKKQQLSRNHWVV